MWQQIGRSKNSKSYRQDWSWCSYRGPREESAKRPRGGDIIGGARSRPKVDLEGSMDRH